MHDEVPTVPAVPAETMPSNRQGWFEFTRQPWFSYFMLILLQLKVVWRAWDFRDVTTGDTSSYYLSAFRWHEALSVNIAWSPLYTAFYGTFHFLTDDPALVTLLHRLAIVFLSSVLVLALFRRLLPPGIAWLGAAWWAILPINFNTLYEVHLFTILPILLVLLLIQYRTSPWARGGALAGLMATTVLVRNELSVAVGLLALVCATWEFLRWKSPDIVMKPRLMQTLSAYMVPLLTTACIVGIFYQRSSHRFPELWQVLAAKHRLNMAQVYCFGYQQRNPDWKGCPWTGYQGLMREHFGAELPSLREMFQANPGAATEHILWNFQLTPNGLQLLLFNSAWGRDNPDYAYTRSRSGMALAMSIIVPAIWVFGFFFAMRDRHYWWKQLIQPHLLTLLTMFCLALVSIPVIATQRPRPSYLFSLSIMLMALTGFWVAAIVHRFAFLKRLSVLMPGCMVAFCFLTPSYYLSGNGHAPQLLNQALNRLKPFKSLVMNSDLAGGIQKSDIVSVLDGKSGTCFLKGEFAFEVRSYLARGQCQSYDYGILGKRLKDQSLESFLDVEGINLFYLDENLLTRLADTDAAGAEPFLGDVGNANWKCIGGQNLQGDRWKLFQRVPDKNLGKGWHGLEHTGEGAPFRWVDNDAELIVTPRRMATTLVLEVEAGPGLMGRPGELTVADQSGKILAAQTLTGRQQMRVPLSASGARKSMKLRLHITNGGGPPAPNDSRILNFRVFALKEDLADAQKTGKQ